MKNSLKIRQVSRKEYAKAVERLAADLREPVSFLQAPFYGEWQEHDGKTVVYFVADDDAKVLAAGLAVKYDAPSGISFFYVPYGPIVREWTPGLLDAIRWFFHMRRHSYHATFVRLDNHPETANPIPNYLAATASSQPRAEWLLDISGKQDDVWMGLHKHARYNVRLAERADARVEFFTPNNTPRDAFFELMHTTAGRDSFSLHTQKYYESILQTVNDKDGFVALCTIEGKPAAVALFVAFDGVLHYVFAGSSDDYRKIAPPYFVIWHAILEAKKRGLHTLNFGGISDPVKGVHLAGVTSFKKRFGGYEVDHSNPIDLVSRFYEHRYFAFKTYKRIKR